MNYAMKGFSNHHDQSIHPRTDPARRAVGELCWLLAADSTGSGWTICAHASWCPWLKGSIAGRAATQVGSRCLFPNEMDVAVRVGGPSALELQGIGPTIRRWAMNNASIFTGAPGCLLRPWLQEGCSDLIFTLQPTV